jgi:hypothetical protein
MGLRYLKKVLSLESNVAAPFFIILATVSLLVGNACSKFKVTGSDGGLSSLAAMSTDSQPALRRLSREEVDMTLEMILFDNSKPGTLWLPADQATPFDSDISTQAPSSPLVEGAESMASDVADLLLLDKARRDKIVGCVNALPSDVGCLTGFIKRIGRLLFRRALTDQESNAIQTLATSEATALGSFDEGIRTVLQILLQHPAFLYRFEVGELNDDVHILNGYERATRLSFMFWGANPDDILLTAAEQGQLDTPEGVRAEALRLIADARSVKRVLKFHSDWFAYSRLPHADNINKAMQAEANAMVEKILFTDNKAWKELLQTKQTYIDATMGAIYKISGLTAPQWVAWAGERKGILSTGAVLSAVPKFSDTSPTQRGKFIRERLMCQIIPPPPPDVDVDSPPQASDGSPCKKKRYDTHRQAGSSCYGCHQMMDPIGFGLERYDRKGAFRTEDQDSFGNPIDECVIEGVGSIANVGSFSGPGQLADLLITTGEIEACMMKQIYHFTFGTKPTGQTDPYLSYLTSKYKAGGGKFKDLMMEVVVSKPFLTRRP